MIKLIEDGKWMGPDMLFTVADAREVRVGATGETVCLKGIKIWAKTYGIDYQEFRTKGIHPQKFIDSGDIRAIVACAKIYRIKVNHGR